jgi:hypothetical protein
MIPEFLADGNLPMDNHPHFATWKEIEERFCNGDHRSTLGSKLHAVLKRAKECKFRKVIIIGSFVTARVDPKDFDLIWLTDPELDVDRLSQHCKELLNAAESRQRLGGDVFSCPENSEMIKMFVSYELGFAVDKITQKPRGLVILDLVNDELS